MSERRGGGLWGALAWLAFPAVPVVLENVYRAGGSLGSGGALSPDPYEWSWLDWVIQSGPLVGFAFLAGVTLGLPDEPTDRRGPRAWLRRRAVWVAAGPWAGYFVGLALIWCLSAVVGYLPESARGVIERTFTNPKPNLAQSVVFWTVLVGLVALCAYGWLLPAVAAVRRARRRGVGWVSVRRGVAVVAAFVGSLYGGFWALTAGWRGFFFDPRILPALLAAASLGLLCGCTTTLTYGDVRRRELFQAMLMAWTFGLALLWLWWGRPRKS